ncbi:hypothetical protein DH09_16335 [Bacillaceae bacterium JMAK1]|nr:hypothetical protein DH09_16335 [Bacillaceae bacterium JMAK1]
MTTVILAEKPDQARSYAAVFSKTTKKKGYILIEDDRFFKGEAVLTWGIGHLVELCLPGYYKKEWKRWSLASLPIRPEKIEFQVPRSKQEQFQIVKTWLKKASEIVIATDPDREGENIARLIIDQVSVKKSVPIKRLWINSQENDVVREGFNNLQPGEKYVSLYEEAKARQIGDWLVGMNASPLYSLLLQEQGVHDTFSVGRVQTPTLYLIYLRQREIENFKPEPYFEITADVTANNGTFKAKYKERLKTKQEVLALYEKHGIERENEGSIATLNKKDKQLPSPVLHSLATLQATANRKWKYSPSKVLKVMQSLYEKKLLSYPRTESNHITSAEFSYLKSKLSAYMKTMGVDFEPAFLHPRKRYVDNQKVQEHYAIIPTKTIPTEKRLASLRTEEQNIYKEVVLTTLAMFAPLYKFEETNVEVDLNGLRLHAKGKVDREKGWKALLSPRQKKEEPSLPAMEVGERVETVMKTVADETKPPSLYTEGQLIPLMKSAGKHVEDEENTAILDEVTGIGTGATRASIIETLKSRTYITVSKNQVTVTEKGKILCQAVEGNLLSKADMTAEWELFLRQIGQGEKEGTTFIANIHQFIDQLIHNAPTSLKEVTFKKESLMQEAKSEGIGPCPLCGSPVISKGRVYGCSGYRETKCKFVLPKTIAKKTLSEASAKRLLTKGSTSQLRGFKSKAGKSFRAGLTLKEGKVEFNFDALPMKNSAKRK